MASTPKLEKTKTPGVYKRGGKYVVTFRDPEGRPRKRFAPSYTAAKALKASLTTAVDNGEYQARSQVTFAEYALNWIETYPGSTAKGIRDETRADYRKRLEQHAIPLLGKLRLSQIDATHLDLLAARVASGPLCLGCKGRGFVPDGGLCRACDGVGVIAKPNVVAADTVRLALAPVKALLATAYLRRHLRFNPAAGYRTRREIASTDHDEEGREDVKALSEDQLTAFLDALETKDEWRRWRPFFEFLALTGLRIGEAVELRWRDIDLGKRSVRVSRRFYRGRVGKPKSSFGVRTVRLSPAVAQQLWLRWADKKPDPDELVFTSEQGHRVERRHGRARRMGQDGGRPSRGHVGRLPQPASHVRDDALPQRLERGPGAAVARSPQAVVHARRVRASDRERCP
jgi:integrase